MPEENRPNINTVHRFAKRKSIATGYTTGENGNMSENGENKQLLHLVFGGELTSLDGVDFRNVDELDIVGIFPNYAAAYDAWKAAAQKTVDNAHMRYFVVHLHRLLSPEEG